MYQTEVMIYLHANRLYHVHPLVSTKIYGKGAGISTQHFIPHSVPSTHIRKNVPSGKKPTERKPLQKSNQCTKSYSGIKKRLTNTMPANLTEAEIKWRDNRP